MIENYYYNENAEILDYTSELKYLINSSARYSEIFSYFKKKDMRNIASLMALFLKQEKKKSNEAGSLKTRIEGLESKVSLLEAELNKKENTIKQLEADLDSLQEQLLGTDKQRCLSMRDLYQAGMSLRKIGEIYGCDKSTVKRNLIKMGVTIRK